MAHGLHVSSKLGFRDLINLRDLPQRQPEVLHILEELAPAEQELAQMLVPPRLEPALDIPGGLEDVLELLSASLARILLINIGPEPLVPDAELLQIVLDFDDVLKPEAEVVNAMSHRGMSLERPQFFVGVSRVCLELNLSIRIGHVREDLRVLWELVRPLAPRHF